MNDPLVRLADAQVDVFTIRRLNRRTHVPASMAHFDEFFARSLDALTPDDLAELAAKSKPMTESEVCRVY